MLNMLTLHQFFMHQGIFMIFSQGLVLSKARFQYYYSATKWINPQHTQKILSENSWRKKCKLREMFDKLLLLLFQFSCDFLKFVFFSSRCISDKLRASRTAISAADVSNEYTLGVPGEPFKFSQCHNKVIVGESSGLKGEVAELEEFIRENVKP